MNKLTFFYITHESKKKAEALALNLLEKRLIACANVVPINSLFWQEDVVQNGAEYVLVCKTLPEMALKVIEEVETCHSYQVPCITCFDVSCNKNYFDWAKNQIAVY